MHSLQPNATFASRYHVVRCIAAGGMGAVYEVVHLETERRRALKVMHAHFVQSAELRDRFKREAKVAAQIESDFVVDVFDAGIDEATKMPFLVMELLKGEELGKRLAAVGRFAAPEAITYLWQTALALDKTHRANIVHRDLKPENLFLTERDDGPPRIKVLDFGVAKFVAETGTKSGQTRSLGTPLYMAPEQFRGQRVAAQADNFALAMMAYTLLVGIPYWNEEAGGDTDVLAFALRAHTGPVEAASVRAARAGVPLPGGFDAWFSKATATDPAARFASATETIVALGEVFGIHPAMITGVAASDPLRPSIAMGMSGSRPSLVGVGTVAMPPLTGDVAALTRTAPRGPNRSATGAVIGISLLALAAVAFAVWFFALRQPARPELASGSSTAPPISSSADDASAAAAHAAASQSSASAPPSAVVDAAAPPSASPASPIDSSAPAQIPVDPSAKALVDARPSPKKPPTPAPSAPTASPTTPTSNPQPARPNYSRD